MVGWLGLEFPPLTDRTTAPSARSSWSARSAGLDEEQMKKLMQELSALPIGGMDFKIVVREVVRLVLELDASKRAREDCQQQLLGRYKPDQRTGEADMKDFRRYLRTAIDGQVITDPSQTARYCCLS